MRVTWFVLRGRCRNGMMRDSRCRIAGWVACVAYCVMGETIKYSAEAVNVTEMTARTKKAPVERPLWRCPKCKRRFVNRNQTHFCGRHDLESHFEGKPAEIRAIFDAMLAAVRRIGPVTVLPEKTRIAFQVRMSFAQLSTRSRWMDGHVVLARRLEHPRFRKIETISARNHVHHFRLAAVSEVDGEIEAWLAEA